MNIVLITTLDAALVLPNLASYHPVQLFSAISTSNCVMNSLVLPQTNATL
jgi:hypothetical protein